MGMLYSQLTEGERNQIYALLQEDVSQCRIAMILGRDSSTIGRELRRNRGQRGYRPKQAQRKAQERRKTPRSFKMTPEVVAFTEEKLREEYSPEQISCTMRGSVGVRGQPREDLPTHLAGQKTWRRPVPEAAYCRGEETS